MFCLTCRVCETTLLLFDSKSLFCCQPLSICVASMGGTPPLRLPGGRSLALDYAPRKLSKLELFLPEYKFVLPKYKFVLPKYKLFHPKCKLVLRKYKFILPTDKLFS